MIVLDIHIWIWWVHGDPRLTQTQRQSIKEHEQDVIGVSAVSCWEVAKLVTLNRLTLPVDVGDWLELALHYPGIRLLELTPRIAVESTRLPKGFHKDPADQIIVATARTHECPLLTSDKKILRYTHVASVG